MSRYSTFFAIALSSLKVNQVYEAIIVAKVYFYKYVLSSVKQLPNVVKPKWFSVGNSLNSVCRSMKRFLRNIN